jgi:glycosyltransferase involved in cell wall biosynthesis
VNPTAPGTAPLPCASTTGDGWPWVAARGARTPAPAGGWPRISVVTPSLDQAGYLEAALRSVLLQGYPNLEYIVLDGGSHDTSVAIIRRYEAHLAYWHSRPDDGQAAAVAEGLERANGEIACWLNSDDILLPGALRHVARLFAAHPRTSFVYGNRLLIDARGRVTGRHVWPRLLTRYHWAAGQPLAQECSFWRRELYRGVGGVDRSLFFTMDHDLFYRMWREAGMRKTSALLGCLRIHHESKNVRHQDVRLRELARARERYGLREAGPLLVRVLARLDRIQARAEQARLPAVVAGSDPGDYGPEGVA